MKKSIKKNYIYNLAYQILVLIVPLITTPYISRVLGAGEVGRVSYAESIVTYFAIFATPGVAILGQREVSYHQDDIEKRSEVFWSIKFLEIITAAAVIGVYGIFSGFRKDSAIYYAMTFTLLSTMIDVSWFFQGMEEFGKIILRNCVIRFINVVYILCFIKTQDDTIKYVLGTCGFSFLANASLWGYIPKYVKAPKIDKLKPFAYASTAFLLFIPTIATRVYTVLDKTMIGVITADNFQNGYYDYAMRISKIVLSVVTALGTVMIPRIGYHFNRNEKSQIEYLMYKSYRAVLLIGIPLCLGLAFVSDNFVPWFFGPGNEEVAVLLKILAWLIIIIGLSTVTGTQYMIPTQKQNWFTFSVCVGAVVNFTLNLFMIARFQSYGAAVASVVAECAVTTVQFIVVRDEISFLRVLRGGWKYALSGVVMSFCIYPFCKNLSSSFLHTMLIVCVGVLAYGFSIILFRDEFVLEILKGLMSNFKKYL
ncbi:Membrane protein involved in the export of O-antigen and teichoic acid [Pseudobutyrivibrio ruminis]|uniref:Membrane protein involved in the export of O-antigen and teichoic acid n=1 Tax=Pseudobutyrivibrio ruminis TaxID=46206 RepID=A0A1H7HD95_9FIRM|nr:flippase [Pseudobutyrivibrio ruminis]SEK46165.1 Membrane protein involved in the export of O-antigen and teichoic acid [Pseudobutyrivibrio ruminis]